MNFYSVRELRTDSKNIWSNLAAGNEVIITNNGKPTALMIGISGENFDETIQAIRQAKAMIAFNEMRQAATSKGFLSDEEIESEIYAVRSGG